MELPYNYFKFLIRFYWVEVDEITTNKSKTKRKSKCHEYSKLPR